MPRFFTRDEQGNPILLLAIEPKTKKITYRADEEFLEKQRKRNTDHIAGVVTELAMREPTSPFFECLGVVQE